MLWTQPRPTFEGKYYHLDETPYSPPNVQQPHPPILIGGGSEPMLRIMAKHADTVSPMIDMAAARSKVEAHCRDFGRNPSELRWEGGGQLFLNDDPRIQEKAVRWAMEQYSQTEEEIRGQLFGSLDQVRERVREQADAGVDEFNIFQLPRIHTKSLLRFSEEVIPQFR